MYNYIEWKSKNNTQKYIWCLAQRKNTYKSQQYLAKRHCMEKYKRNLEEVRIVADYTKNCNLILPKETEHYDVEVANTNNKTIDAELGNKVDKIPRKRFICE